MPIPPVSQFRAPLLQILGDGNDRTLAEAAASVADHFHLTPDERNTVLANVN